MRQSLLAKISAIFLLVILFVLTALCGVGTAVYYGTGFGQTTTFYQSEECRSMASTALRMAWDTYFYGTDHSDFYRYYGTNFGYQIYSLTEGWETMSAEDPAARGELLREENVPEKAGYTTAAFFEDVVVVGYVADPVVSGDMLYKASDLFEMFHGLGDKLAVTMAFLVLAFCGTLVFLLCAAGHREGSEGIVPNHQDRIPLDLYLAGAMLLAFIGVQVIYENIYFHGFGDIPQTILACIVLLGVFLLALATLMTLATRIKLGRWWRNTVTYRIFSWLIRLLRRMSRTVRSAVRLLPYTWRSVLGVGGVLVLQAFLLTVLWNTFSLQGFWFLCLLGVDLLLLGATAFFTWQLQRLFKGGEALASGDLDSVVDTWGMFWDLRRHGENLNAIGQGMNRAVEQRLRSERLKTELITNVSHDIKTPLTSIVNYVDLLKKEELGPTASGYVEVLDRQSRRLKKLTEDLVEASKASTGNVTVNLQTTVVNELIHQAVGEYAERLTAGKLEVVVNTLQGRVLAVADGRLLWRVLDNLLSNVSKYAQPGTRVYIDLKEEGEKVRLSVKNISRDQLNIDAEELTERFVRGDQSRNTEGSGLGLNIAKSLVELMKGEFSLAVDGDLFKAEILLRRAWETSAPPEADAPGRGKNVPPT